MPSDPRTDFLAAASWVNGLVRATKPDQLDLPTPDQGWTVRDLLGHIVKMESVVPMVIAPDEAPLALEPTDATWAEVYEAGLDHIRTIFAEPDLLDRPTTTFFGPMPAGEFIARFISEFLVHGWDLAVSTGLNPEGPTDIAERTFQMSQALTPAEGRNPQAFAAPVEPPATAGPTTKLAAWLGHQVP